MMTRAAVHKAFGSIGVLSIMNRNIIFAMLLGGLLAAVTRTTQAESWQGCRGPRGDGTCMEKDVPTNWDPSGAAKHSGPKL